MADKFVSECPFCGGTEFLEGFQTAYGAITGVTHKMGGTALYHVVCRNCGSVVRSYVKDPELLLKKKERK